MADSEITPQMALDRAKIALMQKEDSVFFATVCFSLKHSFDDSIPTACTNGLYIKFNTKFFMNLTPAERLFLLLHETLHVVFLHMARLNTRKARKWNIACDHVINLLLLSRGFKMPQGGLADAQYKDMTSEQVYALLDDKKVESTPVDLDLQEPDMDPEVFNKELEDIIIQASIQSQAQGDKIGTIPGEVQIFLNNLLKPKLPWQQILQRYLHAKCQSDYTYRKPNRRFFPTHYLPSMYSDGLIDIAIAVDTSGSVTDTQFKQMVSEIDNILRRMKPRKITLIQFDTEIGLVTEVRSANDLMKVRFTGRGGTYIYPVLDWADDNKPQLLLIFTDGEFGLDKKTKSKTEILWLIHSNPSFVAPTGKTIHYNM